MLSAETTTASPIKFGYGPVLYKISLIDLGSFFFSFFLQVRAPAGDVGGGLYCQFPTISAFLW